MRGCRTSAGRAFHPVTRGRNRFQAVNLAIVDQFLTGLEYSQPPT